MGSPGPLEGLRVIELGQLIAGPLAGRMLAEFGAEVIKIEPPGTGDAMREWGMHRYREHALWWPLQSRNKKLVTLDLRREAGRALLLRLVEGADVVIENFRPGTLERWKLGPAELHQCNPRLVIGRVSGYGQTGPYADRPGFASVGEAMGGLRYVNGYPGQMPPRPGVSLGDSLAAMFAVQGILMAVYHRDAHGGPGQVVDASILESCFAMLDSTVPEYGKVGEVRQPSGSRIGSAVPSNTYTARDGKYIVIGANADNLFQRLSVAMGQPELAGDPRFVTHWARFQNVEELDAIIQEWVGRHDAAEIDRVLNAAGVVAGPVYSIADIFADPHYRARGMLVRMEDELLGEMVVPGVVPKLSETPGELRQLGSWKLGANNREVFEGILGLSPEEIAKLETEKVI